MANDELVTAQEAGEKPKRNRDKRDRRDSADSRDKSPYIERVVFINQIGRAHV